MKKTAMIFAAVFALLLSGCVKSEARPEGEVYFNLAAIPDVGGYEKLTEIGEQYYRGGPVEMMLEDGGYGEVIAYIGSYNEFTLPDDPFGDYVYGGARYGFATSDGKIITAPCYDGVYSLELGGQPVYFAFNNVMDDVYYRELTVVSGDGGRVLGPVFGAVMYQGGEYLIIKQLSDEAGPLVEEIAALEPTDYERFYELYSGLEEFATICVYDASLQKTGEIQATQVWGDAPFAAYNANEDGEIEEYFYVSPEGERVAAYEYCGGFEHGMAVIRVNGRCGLIDQNFETLLEPVYEQIDDPYAGYIRLVETGGRNVLLNYDLETVLTSDEDLYYTGVSEDDVAAVVRYNDENEGVSVILLNSGASAKFEGCTWASYIGGGYASTEKGLKHVELGDVDLGGTGDYPIYLEGDLFLIGGQQQNYRIYNARTGETQDELEYMLTRSGGELYYSFAEGGKTRLGLYSLTGGPLTKTEFGQIAEVNGVYAVAGEKYCGALDQKGNWIVRKINNLTD